MATVFENLRVTSHFTLRLCALLRQSGVDIGVQQTLACIEAVLLVERFDEDELRSIYQATLINRKQDLWRLHSAYRSLLKEYRSQPRPAEGDAKRTDGAALSARRRYSDDSSAAAGGKELMLKEGYSIREVDNHKDFRLLPQTDVPAAMTELKRIAKVHACLTRRKSRRTKHVGRVDVRATVRRSVKYDGEILDWRFKRKRPTHSRFAIVCDVSGSMEIYSIFLLNFLYLLNTHRRLRIESFVFSTNLERLTKYFRSKNFPDMLRRISAHFSGWSGGTKIGTALQTLNDTFEKVITPKTCVVIMSDGWDTGDIPLLEREMAKLKRRAKTIIWVNPLKGSPAYEPLALGMAAARPYCDHFITGHSINSLERFARFLAK